MHKTSFAIFTLLRSIIHTPDIFITMVLYRGSNKSSTSIHFLRQFLDISNMNYEYTDGMFVLLLFLKNDESSDVE